MFKPNDKITAIIVDIMTYIEEGQQEEVLKLIQKVAHLSFIDGTKAVTDK